MYGLDLPEDVALADAEEAEDGHREERVSSSFDVIPARGGG